MTDPREKCCCSRSLVGLHRPAGVVPLGPRRGARISSQAASERLRRGTRTRSNTLAAPERPLVGSPPE
ncbi:hypothetical protein C9J85_11000 [Haloferax sp. wsp5]|nr:hypothetical protein C9J85_11000 [Haloferax sp. wsp5]